MGTNSEYIDIANKVINIEKRGIDALKNVIEEEKFTNLIDKLINIKGRVIISGMGKSGHIASKIVASLTSTGTPSYFLHPGEASHGDLGLITKDDIVILLSNSGETKELQDIINYCKRFNIFLIGLVRRKSSILVDASDIPIILPEIEEASEVDAPTTSTTMMLVFGDIITVTLASIKGFTKDDFSIFHPGGKLGSQFIKVDKIMRSDNHIPLCKLNDNMSDIIINMTKKSLGCIGVIDNDNKLIGIITDGDLRRHMSEKFMSFNANNIMSKNPKTINKNALAVEAINIMEQYNITSVFVCQDNKPIGIIHIHDCFKAGIL